jgi:hypothetical protein
MREGRCAVPIRYISIRMLTEAPSTVYCGTFGVQWTISFAGGSCLAMSNLSVITTGAPVLPEGHAKVVLDSTIVNTLSVLCPAPPLNVQDMMVADGPYTRIAPPALPACG